jgi:tRNA-splicing ligase RtcB
LGSVLSQGARWAVQKGFGQNGDVDQIEEKGEMKCADPEKVSARARERGQNQLGTLGSGNHFVEIQYIDEILDPKGAEILGLTEGQVVVMVHTGSRGLGYQVCSDHLEIALASAKKNGIDLVDRELACAPIESQEGKDYLGAMSSAANFAFANRQVITHWVRDVFQKQFGSSVSNKMDLLYDVCHNMAKIEEMLIGRISERVCIHRKGATRAYPPGHPAVPARYRDLGQPIIIPGDMGRYSYILAGKPQAMGASFGSACHGAGRELSRTAAKRLGKGRALVRELEDKGIVVRSSGRHTVLEEMPEAYKDVSDVVRATEHAGIAAVIARVRPIGVVKG